MESSSRSSSLRVVAGLIAMSFLATATFASADDAVGSRPGVSFGGRAMYFRPKDAEHGTLNGGAQLRVHVTSVLALEGSADYRQDKFGLKTVDVFPVQASLMVYLMPGYRFSPYILGGGGWYFTHIQGGGNDSKNRFGPHAGAGMELYLDHHWSIDGSYRYVWNTAIHSQDAQHPVGHDFSDSGFMLTAGLNYLF
jgi:opacity protein-like surface antigen